MSELRIIFTILIFFGAGCFIYFKRHWIDKKLQKTWAIPCLLILAIFFFMGISGILGVFFDDRPFSWENMLRLYGVFSQTSSAYTPPDASDADYLYNLLLSMLGAFLFAGLLLSAFNNMLTQRIQKVKEGRVDYNFSDHIVIIGANDSLLSIIQTVTKEAKQKEKRQILVVTSKTYNELLLLKSIVDSEIWDNLHYINANILEPIQTNNENHSHYLERLNISRCSEIYVLSDSKPGQCDIDTERIVSTIFKYLQDRKVKNRNKINCYLEYSNLPTAFWISKQLNSDCPEICEYINVIPFDFNMMLAVKPILRHIMKLEKPMESIDIVGLTDMGVAMIKVLLLTCHHPSVKNTQINVYYTPEEYEAKRLFALDYKYADIKDISIEFMEIADHTEYMNDAIAKSQVIALCGGNFDKTTKITYAFQHLQEKHRIFLFSSWPLLSKLFENGGIYRGLTPFGNHDQALDFDRMQANENELCELYKSQVSATAPDFANPKFDLRKWRLITLRFLRRQTELTGETVLNQQIAAAVIGGYSISEKTDEDHFAVCEEELNDMSGILIPQNTSNNGHI